MSADVGRRLSAMVSRREAMLEPDEVTAMLRPAICSTYCAKSHSPKPR